MFCRVRACCCNCCDLRHGCIAIAITMLVLNGLSVCLLAVSLQSVDDLRRQVHERPEEFFQGRTPTAAEIDELVTTSKAIAYVSLVVLCISVLFDLILLAGAYKRRKLLLLAWVVWYGIGIIAMVAVGSYVLWATVSSGDHTLELWSYVVGPYVSAAVYVYLIIVVLSYYLDLKDEGNGRGSYALQPQHA